MKLLQLILFSLIFLINFDFYSQTTANIQPSQDTYVNQQAPNAQYSTATSLNVERLQVLMQDRDGNYITVPYLRRGLVQFDLSAYQGAIILSACLTFRTSNSLSNPTIHLERLSSSWTASTATWNLQPTGSGEVLSNYNPTVGTDMLFDVTTQVQKMVQGVFPNNGWKLSLSNEPTSGSRRQYFNSNEAASNKPTLKIIYYFPMKLTAATVSHASDLLASDASVTASVTGGPGGTISYQWFNSSNAALSGQNTLSLQNVGYGWYGLRATRTVSFTNCSGSSVNHSFSFYYAFLVGVNCKEVPITFDPGPFYIDDAGLYSSEGYNPYEYNNYGTLTTLRIGENDGFYEDYAAWENLIRFRLWIDNALTLDEATVKLTGSSFQSSAPNTNAGAMYRVLQDWQESFVTHSSLTNYSGIIAIPMPVVTGGVQVKEYDALQEFNYWKGNNLQNYGLIMRLLTYSHNPNSQYYFSADYITNLTYRPKVVFNVQIRNPVSPNYCDQIFAKLERKLTGVKYEPYLNHLYFYYDEEYATPNEELSYKVFTVSDQINPIMDPTNQSLSQIEYGDNRYTLDVSSLAVGTYILEVTNNKKEKFFLRFQKVD